MVTPAFFRQQPASAFVCLMSAEGERFIVSREAAFISNTIRAMVDGPFDESEPMREVYLSDISSPLLSKVCEYFAYRVAFNAEGVPWMLQEFPIEPELHLPLLRAAAFLDC